LLLVQKEVTGTPSSAGLKNRATGSWPFVTRGQSYEDVMKRIFATALVFAALTCASKAADLNTARIDELTGLKGKFNEKEGVYKVTFPRNDVKVVVDGWTMPPFMGLGTWAAFTSTKNGAMVMGRHGSV
jgi:hypothetical protein